MKTETISKTAKIVEQLRKIYQEFFEEEKLKPNENVSEVIVNCRNRKQRSIFLESEEENGYTYLRFWCNNLVNKDLRQELLDKKYRIRKARNGGFLIDLEVERKENESNAEQRAYKRLSDYLNGLGYDIYVFESKVKL